MASAQAWLLLLCYPYIHYLELLLSQRGETNMPISENPYICDSCGRVTIESGETYADCPICGEPAQYDIEYNPYHNDE